MIVVDREVRNRERVRRWLTAAGFDCFEAARIEEALDAPEPAVAVVAATRETEFGLASAARLRAHWENLPLILTGGRPPFDVALRGIRAGVVDYLRRPCNREQIVRAVTRAVGPGPGSADGRAVPGEAGYAGHATDAPERTLPPQRVTDMAVAALLASIQAASEEMYQHARRVADMAVQLAAAVGLPADSVAHVEQAALLHDLGKIALPAGILQSRGPVSDDDLALVRTHPLIARDIIDGVPGLEPVARIVVAAQEHVNGTGYPSGLRGPAIPVGARILAIADHFDAMTSWRVYRDPLSPAAACAELTRAAGAHYDADLVGTWLRVLDRALQTA